MSGSYYKRTITRWAGDPSDDQGSQLFLLDGFMRNQNDDNLS